MMRQQEEKIGRLVKVLASLCEHNVQKLMDVEYVILPEAATAYEEFQRLFWRQFPGAMDCGGEDRYTYFRMQIKVPDSYEGKHMLYCLPNYGGVQWDTVAPQFRAYVNGELYQGMDVNHETLLLTEQAKAGDCYEIILGVYTGKMQFHTIMDARIAVLDVVTEQYYYDCRVPYEIACLLETDDRDYLHIMDALNESLKQVDLRQPYSREYYRTMGEADQYLKQVLYEKLGNQQKETVYCVGHTHIDIAWLWTIEVAKDKAARSFSTVLRLMKEYPEYKFMSSQPFLYQAIKEKELALYEEIRQRVAEGRWETEGGMYVEADCNLASGESLVRQFVKGKEFFQKEFGKDNVILWLPDVFGYSAALPQIMKKCGIHYFTTTKISWNEFNQMPYDTFYWTGIDGTKTLTHFVPSRDYGSATRNSKTNDEHCTAFTTNYNGYIYPSQIKGSWQRYQQKFLNDAVMMSYGYGDGGGGPTKEMLEIQRRLSYGLPGCPATKQASALEFFQKLEKDVSNHRHLPEWNGELYLEYHRGTYTSMARNKKYNRKSEFLLHNLELYASIRELWEPGSYPKEKLDQLWELLLHNQFHDILPGSSIEEVYEVSKLEYEKLLQEGGELLKEIVEDLTEQIDAPTGSIVVYNPNGMEGSGPVIVPMESLSAQMAQLSQRSEEDLGKSGKDLANRMTVDRNLPKPAGYLANDVECCPYAYTRNGELIFYASHVPAAGYQVYRFVERAKEEQKMDYGTLHISSRQMENAYLCLHFNEAGQFDSIYDKRNKREVLMSGACGNVLMSYEDRPHNWDAWDVNIYYPDKSWEINEVSEFTIEEANALRICMKVARTYLNSTIVQYISLNRDSARIDIRTEIDWKEEHIFVKALFPVDIHCNEADYEIQYGNVSRPTHHNTSWDEARFEVCHHKWLDVHENNYGVSLINDCKYGCHVHNGVIGLSLLKSATYPNPTADKERHEFTYSLYPHAGDFRTGGTIKEAYELNNPMFAQVKRTDGKNRQERLSAAEIDCPNVVLEVVKTPENEEQRTWIYRMYECYNERSQVTITLPQQAKRAILCTMLEQEEQIIAEHTSQITCSIKPYEILTCKVEFEANC